MEELSHSLRPLLEFYSSLALPTIWLAIGVGIFGIVANSLFSLMKVLKKSTEGYEFDSSLFQGPSRSGIGYSLLKWHALLVCGSMLCIDFVGYVSVRLWVLTWEFITRKQRSVYYRMNQATNYDNWKRAARQLDRLLGQSHESPHPATYDRHLIRDVQERLTNGTFQMENAKTIEEKKEALDVLMRALSTACVPNLGGVDNEELYSHCYLGENTEVIQYISSICRAIQLIRQYASIYLSPQRSLNFLRQLRKSYGQTALCLSGGASNGYFHIGVIKCLFEQGLLPSIITGSSAGALIGSLVCVRTDEELKETLCPQTHKILRACEDSWSVIISRLFEKGTIFDEKKWEEHLQAITLGPTTFLEAYQRTGRVLNISMFSGRKRSCLLNYKTAPNVVIYSAVLASAAVPLLLPTIELKVKSESGEILPYHELGKGWKDGSIVSDIPFDALHQMFDVNFTIVSQVEPHIAPFFFEAAGSAGKPTRHRAGKGWRGGFISSFLEDCLKLDMKKWLKLMRNFELLPHFFSTDWTAVFLQRTWGCVTIVPKLSFRDYSRILTDPGSEEDLQHYIVGGERATWPKIGMIKNHLKTEIELCDGIGDLSPVDSTAGASFLAFDTTFDAFITNHKKTNADMNL